MNFHGLKSKTAKIGIAAACCLMIFSAGAVYAAGNGTAKSSAVSQQADAGGTLAGKHNQIDQYVFKQHADVLKKKGITVTNTGVQDGVVVIGITPYNKKNADFLYGLFGTKQVKVVQGHQAVTLGTAAAPVKQAAAVQPAVDDGKASSPNTMNPAEVIAAAAALLAIAALITVLTRKRGKAGAAPNE